MCVLEMVPGSTCECHPLSRLARSDAVDVEEHSLVTADRDNPDQRGRGHSLRHVDWIRQEDDAEHFDKPK